jgi:hypothetical protein
MMRHVNRRASKSIGPRNPHGLPEKVCIVCGRGFVWRKKWARDWDRVQVCSDKCRMQRAQAPGVVERRKP